MFQFFNRKKTAKKIDLSALGDSGRTQPGPDFSSFGPAGPAIPIDVPDEPVRDSHPYGDWFSLGEKAWDVLADTRIKEIFPECESRRKGSEFLLYWDLIRRSSLKYRNEIFIGLGATPGPPAPLFVPRSTFDSHAYILGKSDRGKTSQSIATLLWQLAQPVAKMTEELPSHLSETEQKQLRTPPAIVILDLKPQGDRFLREFAEQLAWQRDQYLNFFSNAKQYESLHFDPWATIGSLGDVQAQAETLFKALSLIHPEGQDAVFFMNEQRYVLEEALLAKPKSLWALIDDLRARTRERGGNSEARGVHGALSIFRNAVNVVVDENPPAGAEVIDFRALLDKRAMLYVHLDSDEKNLSSQATGKLLLYCLLAAAKQRRENSRLLPAKVYVVIDEFHRLAAQNVVSMLETSRDLGVSFILSHQSPESLRSKNDDLFATLFDTTSFQQYLSLTNPQTIEQIRLLSGRRSEFLRSSNRGTTNNRSETAGWTRQQSTGTSTGRSGGGPDGERWSEGWHKTDSVGDSGSTSTGWAEQQGTGESESKIPGLTPEMVAEVTNPAGRVSLVLAWGRSDSAISPHSGLPFLVERIFPVSKELADSWREKPWPQWDDSIDVDQHAPEQRSAPLLPEKPGKKPKTKATNYNDIAGDLFNDTDPDAVGGQRPAAQPKRTRKKPKKTKGSEEPFV